MSVLAQKKVASRARLAVICNTACNFRRQRKLLGFVFVFPKIIRQKLVIALFIAPSIAFQTAVMWLFGLCPLITSLI